MRTIRVVLLLAIVTMSAYPLVEIVGAASDPFGWANSQGGRTLGKVDKDQREKGRQRQEQAEEAAGNPPNHDKGVLFGEDRKHAKDNDNGELKERDVAAQKNGEKTNVSPLSDYQIEGYVTSLNCDVKPKEITIRNLDGFVLLYQMIDKHEKEYAERERFDLIRCGDLVVGDYLFVQEGEKINEGLYNAFRISCTQKRDDERRNNSNDNDEIGDPNCRLILHRPNP